MDFLRIIILAAFLSGCTTTGQSVGVSHGFTTEGDSQYAAPHYTHETEKVDVKVKYYHFNNPERIDFMEADWKYKF